MNNLVAAPDKFKSTARASDISAAIVSAGRILGWHGQSAPLSDGGEGLLDAVGGEARTSRVTGPLGTPILAEWRLLPSQSVRSKLTAVIEMARASGLEVIGGPTANDPVMASTFGTGELILAALDAGAQRIIVGCGGSATTDGGDGALRAIGNPANLQGVELICAADVTTRFVNAARTFAPQKGADPDDVELLTARLKSLVGQYQVEFGIDVGDLRGSGAAGGLAGGLAAIGAQIVSGFALVSRMVGLEGMLRQADAVVTGEGQLDRSSFSGKVVGEVLHLLGSSVPTLVVAGRVDNSIRLPGFDADVISLVERFGETVALNETIEVIALVVKEWLQSL